MAKQIYIDENGNENLVSGTINNASLLPISANDPTNTKDYIDSGLSVNYAISTSPLNPNDTFQIPSTIMDNNTFVLVGFRRFETYATFTVSLSAIKSDVLKTQAPIAQVDGSRYWRSKISSTGLITLLSSADSVAPYIEVYGFL